MIVFTIETHVVEPTATSPRRHYGATVERVEVEPRAANSSDAADLRLLCFVEDNVRPHLRSLQRTCETEEGAATRARQAALYLLATQMTGGAVPLGCVRFEVNRCTDCDWSAASSMP